MDFVDLYRRISNMVGYGMTLAEIHGQLVDAEGVTEEMFFFAYKAVDTIQDSE
jgi:uncharacterized protein Usg